jgi:hypothetical protein
MGIFGPFKTGKFAPKWTYSAKGVIWRILFSENWMIVGEDRNEEEKSVTYFCVDELSGRILWRGKKYGREWWSGIDAVDGNSVFIHGYASPEMPEHKGIIAVDIVSGKILWKNPDLRLLSVRGGIVVGVHDDFDRSFFYRLDQRTGAILDESTDRDAFGILPGLACDESLFTFPETLIPGGNEYCKIIDEYIRREELIGSVEYLEHDDMLLFNYYIKNSGSTPEQIALDNCLNIISIANEKLLFSEMLDKNVAYPVPDAFFIHNDILFYIKNRSILTAVRL